MKRPRTYTRISAEQLAELQMLWEQGRHTLEELVQRFGMSRRGVQAALARVGAVKGSKPQMRTPTPPASPKPSIPSTKAFNEMSQEERLVIARRAAWSNADELEALAMTAAREVAAHGASVSTVRTLELAASVVGRARNLRWSAMGLDGKLPPSAEDLPELVFREITPEEIARLRAQQEREALGGGYDDAEYDHLPGDEEEEEEQSVKEKISPPMFPERMGGDDGPMRP